MNKWELSIRAFSRVNDVPSELGSPTLVQYVEDGASMLSEMTGQSVDLDDVGSKFHPALTAFATAMILGYKEGVGISYELGTMKIDKRTELDGASKQLEQQLNLFNMSVKMLGNSMGVSKTEPLY